jgi:aryl-alcohol dehydrogenase-like predicted oxidoreductase
VYGFGLAERIVGVALEGRRKQAVVATKTGLEWSGGTVYRNASRTRIMREIDDSLRRLRPIISTSTRSIGPTHSCRWRKPPR